MTNALLTTRGTVRSKRMFSRTTLARLSIGLVLGVVLGAVLYQSNTRDPALYATLLSQGAFGAPGDVVVTSATTVEVGSCMKAGCVPSSADPLCYVPDGTPCSGPPGMTGCQCGAGSCVMNCVAVSSSSSCNPVDDLNASQCCIDSGPPYSDSCCAYNPNWCSSSSSVSCDPVDDLNASQCCIDSGPPYSDSCCAYNPNWCPSSSSSSSECEFDDDCTDSQHVCCDGVCQMPDLCYSSSSSSSSQDLQYCCVANQPAAGNCQPFSPSPAP